MNVLFFLLVAEDDQSKAKTSNEIDIFKEDYVHVTGLTPNTKYVFQIIARNDEGVTPGDWDEEKTSGHGKYTVFIIIQMCVFVIEEVHTVCF